jgi:hypothetical protein
MNAFRWSVRHCQWVFAAALALLLLAAVLGALNLASASMAAGLLTVALFAALVCAGLVAEQAARAEFAELDDDADDAFFGGVTGGDPLGRRSVREYARTLALSSPAVRITAVAKSQRRHARRHGGAAS